MTKNIDNLFFLVGLLLLSGGMVLGEVMGMSGNHALMPVHVHINLAGGVFCCLFGIAYRLWPALNAVQSGAMTALNKSRWLLSATLACITCLWTASAQAVTDADRIAVYREFRSQFDARKYAEAQPLAQRRHCLVAVQVDLLVLHCPP